MAPATARTIGHFNDYLIQSCMHLSTMWLEHGRPNTVAVRG
jgi:hypothetical protein